MPELSTPPPQYASYPRNPGSKLPDNPSRLFSLGEGCLELEIVPFFPLGVIATVILLRGPSQDTLATAVLLLWLAMTCFFNYLAASKIGYGLRWKKIVAPLLSLGIGWAILFFAKLPLPGTVAGASIAIVQIGFFVVMRRLAAHELRKHGLQLRGLLHRRRSFREDFDAYLEATADTSMAHPPGLDAVPEVG